MFFEIVFFDFYCIIVAMRIKELVIKFLLKILISVMYLFSNEIVILNAAVTYYALLSFVPMLIILGVVFQKIIFMFPETLDIVDAMMKSIHFAYLDSFDLYDMMSVSKGVGFGVFGFITIFFTSTLFLRSINKVFKKIFRIRELKETILHSLIPFMLYFAFLFMILITIIIKIMLVTIEKFLVFYLDIDFSGILDKLGELSVVPVVIFFVLFFVAYYFLSMRRISLFNSLKVSLYFMISLYFLNMSFKYFYNVSFYNAVYGALSSIVITLAYIFMFFLLFIFWAQYGYVDRNYNGVVIKIFFEEAVKNPNSFLVNYLSKLLKGNVVRLDRDEKLNLKKYAQDFAVVLDGSFEIVGEDGLPIYINKFDFFNLSDISDNVSLCATENSLLLLISMQQREFLNNDSAVASGIFMSNEKMLIV